MARNKKSPSPKDKKIPGKTGGTSVQAALSIKEQAAIDRKKAQARKAFMSYFGAVVAISLVASMMVAIVGGVKGAVGSFVAIASLLLAFKYPWQSLYAFIIYLPFSGTITYVIGAGSNPLMQLAKDAFYVPALIGVIQYCKRRKIEWFVPKALKPPVLLLLGYCILVLLFINGGQQLAPTGMEKPFLMGILGLKVFMGYIPLIPCTYYLLRTKDEFFRMMRLMTVLILICCALGMVQYMFLKTGRCQGTVGEGSELFKASLESRCLVGGSLLFNEEQGVIRLPGTFVAPWQWGWFLISSAFFTFATAFSDRTWYWRLIGILGMVMTMVMAVLSGQRIALALVPVCYGILLITTGQLVNLARFLPILILLGLFIVGALASYPEVVQERVDSFVSRWEASPPTEFIADQFSFVQDLSGLLGKGLGRATNSARAMGDVKLIETYFPKVMFEIGPLGLLLFLGLVTTLTIITFKAFRQVKDKNLRGMGAALWTYVLLISYNTYYYPLDVDPVAVYYWFAAGMILKLPELDREVDTSIEPEVPKKKRRRGPLAPKFGGTEP